MMMTTERFVGVQTNKVVCATVHLCIECMGPQASLFCEYGTCSETCLTFVFLLTITYGHGLE